MCIIKEQITGGPAGPVNPDGPTGPAGPTGPGVPWQKINTVDGLNDSTSFTASRPMNHRANSNSITTTLGILSNFHIVSSM